MFYILLILSAYFSFKEFKKPQHRKLLVFVYASIFIMIFMYNAGTVTGEVLYHLGVSI